MKNSMQGNWRMLFERLDTDGSGMLHYGEFQEALRDVLSLQVAEELVWGLWCNVDADRSTQVTIGEFQSALYLLLLDAWPVLDTGHLKELCEQVNDAAVHEFSKEGSGVSSGNWFQIFNKFDTDESGRLGFEELEGVTRMRDPGLNLQEEDLSTHDLKGLWKAIDGDGDGAVTVDEFMSFMRRNYDPLKEYKGPRHRDLTKDQRKAGEALEESALNALVCEMHVSFDKICFAWNVKSCMNKNWAMLFERLDLDGSGRLDFDEFAAAVNDVLKLPFSDEQLWGLWSFVDEDRSAEVTIKEFQQRLYLLVLSGWPLLGKKTLKRLCNTINEAAVHEFSKEGSGVSDGNWFAIFNKFDTDESGRLGFEELEGVTRMRDPGLNLKVDAVSQEELRGLWRAIDADSSGDVTVDEFMHFMKVHGPRFDGQFIAIKNISHEQYLAETEKRRKLLEEKELRETRKQLVREEKSRLRREAKHLENVARLKKLREIDFRDKLSPAYRRRRVRQVGQLAKLSKSPLLAGCEDIIPFLKKPGAHIPEPLANTGGRRRIEALKEKRLADLEAKRVARQDGAKKAMRLGALGGGAFGRAGAVHAEARRVAEAEAKARRFSGARKSLLATAAGSGAFGAAGVARAEARAIAKAELEAEAQAQARAEAEAQRVREAPAPESPAPRKYCWGACAPAPAPAAWTDAPAPAAPPAELEEEPLEEAYSEEEEEEELMEEEVVEEEG